MKKPYAVVMSAAFALTMTSPAWGHVTVNPSEAPPGSFFRFAVRVPNERPDADTIKVEMRFPETLLSVGFQDVPGWKRTVTMKTLDEPVELFGTEITEVIDTVTWEGGTIQPHEFEEFGFSGRVPEETGALEFPAIQTYSSGEEVQWTGPEDSETPVATVDVLDYGAAEGEGQLAVLARLQKQVAALGGGEAREEEGSTTLPLMLGAGGLLLGLIALVVALRRPRAGGPA